MRYETSTSSMMGVNRLAYMIQTLLHAGRIVDKPFPIGSDGRAPGRRPVGREHRGITE
jgi:hypothetical protein